MRDWRFWLPIIGALILAVLCSAPLTTDGSYYLFSVIANDFVMTPNNRLIHPVLQLPALWMSGIAQTLEPIALAFNLPYALMPLLALVSAAWVSHRRERAFLWAAFGICILTLPGQIIFISEGAIALQFAWALWICACFGVRARDLPILIFVTVLIFFTHPSAPLLFGVTAVIAALRAYQTRTRAASAFFIVWTCVTVAAGLRIASVFNAYEADQVTNLTVMINRFIASVGSASPMLLLAFGAAVMVWRGSTSARLRWVLWGTLAAGILWALVPTAWMSALDYRFFALFLSLPFVALMALDKGFVGKTRAINGVLPLLALTFALVIGIQSVTWAILRADVRAAVNAPRLEEAAPCLPFESLPNGERSILNHWSVTPLSLLEGGRSPQRIVFYRIPCLSEAFTAGIPIAEWETRTTVRWFDLGAFMP